MPGLVEVDLASRLESANRHIAELEIANAAAAIELDSLSVENERLLRITEERAKRNSPFSIASARRWRRR